MEGFRQNLDELYADELRKVKEIDQDFLEAARKRLGLVTNMDARPSCRYQSRPAPDFGTGFQRKAGGTRRYRPATSGLKLMEEGATTPNRRSL